MTSSGSATTEFEPLLAEVLEPAYRTAYHLTRNREDAEELVQEAALLAFRGFARFEPGTNFRAWFMTILRNRFISTYRKKRREVPTVDLEDASELYLYAQLQPTGTPEEVSEPAKRLIAQLDAEQVSAALAALPDEFREAATLYFTQDLSYQEIAQVLDVPVGTIRSRLHRARRLLQRQLWDLAEEYGIVSPNIEQEDAS